MAQLAHGLRRLGVRPGERVATFLWNTQEHLEAYFAIPCMGAVLHTLNIRLSDDEIEFIVYDAEDRVVIVDMSLASQLAAMLPRMETVHTVVAVGDGDLSVLQVAGKNVVGYDDLLADQSTHYEWPDIDEKSAAAMCYTSGTTGHPKGVVYGHRSTWRPRRSEDGENTTAEGPGRADQRVWPGSMTATCPSRDVAGQRA